MMSAPYPLFKYIIVGHFCKHRDRYHKIFTIPHPLIKYHSLSPTTNNVTLFYLVAVIFSFVIIISMRGQLPFHHLNCGTKSAWHQLALTSITPPSMWQTTNSSRRSLRRMVLSQTSRMVSHVNHSFPNSKARQQTKLTGFILGRHFHISVYVFFSSVLSSQSVINWSNASNSTTYCPFTSR